MNLKQIAATISFEREGKWTIEGKALHGVGNGDVWGTLLISTSLFLTTLTLAFPQNRPQMLLARKRPTPISRPSPINLDVFE
ncbi:MAG: hypothetical protein M5U34_27785 [Chloroflexi bacterium]|nr:hypothetical protein [Chloroflexota bacterium]